MEKWPVQYDPKCEESESVDGLNLSVFVDKMLMKWQST